MILVTISQGCSEMKLVEVNTQQDLAYSLSVWSVSITTITKANRIRVFLLRDGIW